MLLKCGLWLYALTLLAALIAVYFLWAAPLFWRILINVLMIFTTPYPKDLFMTYDEYVTLVRSGEVDRAKPAGNA